MSIVCLYCKGALNPKGLKLKRENNIIEHLLSFNVDGARKWFEAEKARPLSISFIPTMFTEPINSFAVPITGFLLMLAGACYFGWKSSLTAIPGAIIAVLGPTLGVPEVGPLSAQMVSLAIGAVLIAGVSWFVRK